MLTTDLHSRRRVGARGASEVCSYNPNAASGPSTGAKEFGGGRLAYERDRLHEKFGAQLVAQPVTKPAG
jgi:hypothetical protein